MIPSLGLLGVDQPAVQGDFEVASGPWIFHLLHIHTWPQGLGTGALGVSLISMSAKDPLSIGKTVSLYLGNSDLQQCTNSTLSYIYIV